MKTSATSHLGLPHEIAFIRVLFGIAAVGLKKTRAPEKNCKMRATSIKRNFEVKNGGKIPQ
jgi:hypothetical protein